MSFDPHGIIKRTKGKMIMLYAVKEDGSEEHMASFFHADKAEYVLEAIGTYDDSLDITDEDAKPKKAPARKKVATKKSAPKKMGRRR